MDSSYVSRWFLIRIFVINGFDFFVDFSSTEKEYIVTRSMGL